MRQMADIFDVKKSETVGLAKKIIKDKDAREKTILYAGMVVNYFFVIFQLYGGILYKSVWFTALGVYYAVLTSVRLYIGVSSKKRGGEAWKVFRMSGWALTIANIALVVMISVMVAAPGVAIHGYSLLMAVGVTVWTVYLMISAVIGIVRHWKEENTIALAANSVQLIGAVVSILLLQTAMIASYGTLVIEKTRGALEHAGQITRVPTEVGDLINNLVQIFVVSNRITGVLVAVVVLGITVYMIVKGSREYKKSLLEKNT